MAKITEKQIEKVADWIQRKMYDLPRTEFVIRDHHHEGLTPGAWSIAVEGYEDGDWAIEFAWELQEKFPKYFFEPIYGFMLGVYPG